MDNVKEVNKKIQEDIAKTIELKRMVEMLGATTEIKKEEYPDKITWGDAKNRKEFKFNASNEEETALRLENFFKVSKFIEDKEAEVHSSE